MGAIDIAVPLLSAAGGGLTVGWLLRLTIQRYLQAHDEMVKGMSTMAIQLTRIEERVGTLQSQAIQTQANTTGLALMQSQITKLTTDLNGIGHKVRGLKRLDDDCCEEEES